MSAVKAAICDVCDGAGDLSIPISRPTRSRYADDSGLEYDERLEICPTCHGAGLLQPAPTTGGDHS